MCWSHLITNEFLYACLGVAGTLSGVAISNQHSKKLAQRNEQKELRRILIDIHSEVDGIGLRLNNKAYLLRLNLFYFNFNRRKYELKFGGDVIHNLPQSVSDFANVRVFQDRFDIESKEFLLEHSLLAKNIRKFAAYSEEEEADNLIGLCNSYTNLHINQYDFSNYTIAEINMVNPDEEDGKIFKEIYDGKNQEILHEITNLMEAIIKKVTEHGG